MKQRNPQQDREDISEFLDYFENEIYFVFGARGFSRNTALNAYLNMVLSSELIEEAEDNDGYS